MMICQLIIVILVIFINICIASNEVSQYDSYDEKKLQRIAFGSCFKQWKDPKIFNHIAEYRPDIWIWLGDAYYTSKKQYINGEPILGNPLSIESLIHAKNRSQSVPEYQAMVKQLAHPVIGTYDDHDRGVNDGGGVPGALRSEGVDDRDLRKEIFRDFLQVQNRRKRDGVYASHVYGTGSRRVKVILLDTRYSRTQHIIPSVAHIKHLAVIAAITRVLSAMFSLTNLQEGDILGDAQWRWLEEELRDSRDQQIGVNIIGSSIQILTSNPSLESWGHFPIARMKLISLLHEYDPQGLILMSGDVHFAEVLHADPHLEPIEYTSSGLTHDCSDGGIPKFVCNFVNWLFGKHRSEEGFFFTNKNFGVIDIDWWDEQEDQQQHSCPYKTLDISFMNDNGENVYTHSRTSCATQGVLLPHQLTDFVSPWYFQSLQERLMVLSLTISAIGMLGLIVMKLTNIDKKLKHD